MARNDRYVALIGDIRGSRQLEDRAGVQEELRQALEQLPEELDEATVSRPVITTGDEFQGLFHTPRAAVEALGRLDERFVELSFAFGIGVGGLDTDLREEAVGMDGPCFHHARAALEAAKDESVGIRVAGFGAQADRLASAVLALVAATRSDWTKVQARYARALRDAATQQAVAERFDRSKSSVSESLAVAHVREVRAAEREAAIDLQRRMEERPATAHGGDEDDEEAGES